MSDKTWIQTFTKKRFEPMRPDPAMINIADIAHALSMICRYTGHVKEFYSVAEHSVRVSWAAEAIAEAIADMNGDGKGTLKIREIARAGLLHDATEAYMNDVARPVKHGWSFFWYRRKERQLQRMIFKKYGLDPKMPDEVHRADDLLLFTEAKAPRLMAPVHPDWPIGESLDEEINPWTQKKAEHMFLRRYFVLWPEVTLRDFKREALQ